MIKQTGGLKTDIIRALEYNPGLSDVELAKSVQGHGASPQYVNQCCKELQLQGILWRNKRDDGRIGNWLKEESRLNSLVCQTELEDPNSGISEKKIKQFLEKYLVSGGWEPDIDWGIKSHGIDIESRRGVERWIIQVKGSGSFRSLVVDNFLLVIGEIIQRMNDPKCKYSIALPDSDQFRRLWGRVPELAKSRIGVTALFVDPQGSIAEEV